MAKPEKLPAALHDEDVVLASGSLALLNAFTQEYGSAVSTIEPRPPENEPRDGGSRRAATAKNSEIADLLIDTDWKDAVVISADVAFVWNSDFQHRGDRDGIPSAEKEKSLLQMAIERYATKPFQAEWDITFALWIPKTQQRVLTTVTVFAQFQKPLPPKDVISEFSVASNAMVKLAELGAKHNAVFLAKMKGNSFPETHSISSQNAIMLIRDKVLPRQGMVDLLESPKVKTYTDKEKRKWEVRHLDLKRFRD